MIVFIVPWWMLLLLGIAIFVVIILRLDPTLRKMNGQWVFWWTDIRNRRQRIIIRRHRK